MRGLIIMSSLIEFEFEQKQIRFVGTADDPWWVAADICDTLEISNVSQKLQTLDEDERSMFNIGRQGEAWCVNESGLYSLILRSRKPQAKRFKKWVTSDYLIQEINNKQQQQRRIFFTQCNYSLLHKFIYTA